MSRDQFIKRATLLGISATGDRRHARRRRQGDRRRPAGVRSLAGSTVNLLVAAEGDREGCPGQDRRDQEAVRHRRQDDRARRRAARSRRRTRASRRRPAPTTRSWCSASPSRRWSAAATSSPLNAVRQRRLRPGYDFPATSPRASSTTSATSTSSRRHVRRQDPLPDPRPARRLGRPLLPQGPVQGRPAWRCRRPGRQYLAAAKKLNGNGVAGNSMIAKSGDVSMFLVDWYTRFANSGGAADERHAAGEELHPAADQPAGRRGAAAHGRLRAVRRPRACSSYDFTASTDAFSAGKTAMMLMWSTIGGPVYNPKTSKVAGKVAVGVAARQGHRRCAAAGAWASRRTRRTRTPPGRSSPT